MGFTRHFISIDAGVGNITKCDLFSSATEALGEARTMIQKTSLYAQNLC